MKSLTLDRTLEKLHVALRDYIEATYHISNPKLIHQRRNLLNQLGVIHQKAYLESTPRYISSSSFSDIEGLDPAILECFNCVTAPDINGNTLIYDPPYDHQLQSVTQSLVKDKNLIVITGTGSGKTECFLLPILGKLAREAKHNSSSFREHTGVRAILLYPMNALVNDQLGRLRQLFTDERLVQKFIDVSGRPVRFARYTSRTLYPGVRNRKKDQIKLRPIKEFYVNTFNEANDSSSPNHEFAKKLFKELKAKGKWPGKPNISEWYGKDNSRWDNDAGEFLRCITRDNDIELLTRHEIQENPPDILITNYSMLEYMMMRPIERPIFDSTCDWLKNNPDEKLLLIVDEAHLYRGAAGAEVALLIRRLRKRLNISSERLQVICTSASFADPDKAKNFAAELTGTDPNSFEKVEGKLQYREPNGIGTIEDVEALATIDLNKFYASDTEEDKFHEISDFLNYRKISTSGSLENKLFEALDNYPLLNQLVNTTMGSAKLIESLGEYLFNDIDSDQIDTAITNLLALGSLARQSQNLPGLLPCRVHQFFRGIPGLWICLDPNCTELESNLRGGAAGKLYSQPNDICGCGSKIFELYTCRNCGTAYARAYTDDIDEPDYLWNEPGIEIRLTTGRTSELEPLDILLEEPVSDNVEIHNLDLISGRLDPEIGGERERKVYLRKNRIDINTDEESTTNNRRGEFRPCAVCEKTFSFGTTFVQDHKTKGDEPFQSLISSQIEVQPPSNKPSTHFAPLRGRKVLVFSDSRQVAARLAPKIQNYSMRDVMRVLIVYGFNKLIEKDSIKPFICLSDIYLAVLIAAVKLDIRLRPELKPFEVFPTLIKVEEQIQAGALDNDQSLLQLLMSVRLDSPPEMLLNSIFKTITDSSYGLEALALASVVEAPHVREEIYNLPDINGLAETKDEKIYLVRIWIRCWLNRYRFWLSQMPGSWSESRTGYKTHSGNFNAMNRVLINSQLKREFKKYWLPSLLRIFTDQSRKNKYRLNGGSLSLEFTDTWTYCNTCRSIHFSYTNVDVCLDCGRDSIESIEPNTNEVFLTRKGYYRNHAAEILKNPDYKPSALIAAEHTAQLNAAQSEDIFSEAEINELLFQDVNIGSNDSERTKFAIDVISCTTTMEVGIDIGALSGIALRNMPPSRANYQQRAGRAGRRGDNVATVIAYGSADSHDEHFFSNPQSMISGPVNDPKLTLNNYDITRRHVTAYLLQRYHQERLPDIAPEGQHDLFSVLGTVEQFQNNESILNRNDFFEWLSENQELLEYEILDWIPKELDIESIKRLKNGLVNETIENIDNAIDFKLEDEKNQKEQNENKNSQESDVIGEEIIEAQMEAEDEQPVSDSLYEKLLNRFLYRGILPRYAFPTDVATFHIFDEQRSTSFRPIFQYTPSQGLPIALTQYAPGKDVWVAGKLYFSGAIYSPLKSERSRAWQLRRYYFHCSNCGFATTEKLADATRGERRDCPACGGESTFGRACYWLRPPGFAHRFSDEPDTSPDDTSERSYATRAKLTMDTPSEQDDWVKLNERLRIFSTRQHLLVTNNGPRNEGYNYCTYCGLIEPSIVHDDKVFGSHKKPFPDEADQICPGGRAARGIVLGTDFITDISLISLSIQPPLLLQPGLNSTDFALRTICEALSLSASTIMQLEPGEVIAEYRPALTEDGVMGKEAEIFLYDTLPGGAGFSTKIETYGDKIFWKALEILEHCPDNCDRSCYRCLRNYKNKFEHGILDRQLGATLLRYLLTGKLEQLNTDRIISSTNMLYEDIKRQDTKGIVLYRDKIVEVQGIGDVNAPIYVDMGNEAKLIIALTNGITPGYPTDKAIRDVMEYSTNCSVIPVDELLVRYNLPEATLSTISKING